jgi:hypothetical protein
MIIAMIVLLTIYVGFLSVLFFFLHQRMEKFADKMGTLYANIDILHKNQEELLAQNLRMFHDNRQKDSKKGK